MFRSDAAPYPVRSHVGTALLIASLVLAKWCCVIGGCAGSAASNTSRKPHSVLLTWTPSSSPVVGYNIYRSSVHGSSYHQINKSPVQQPTFTDADVKSGETYFYVIRSVNAQGHESVNSSEVRVKIPL